MKKSIYLFAIILALFSCKNNDKAEANTEVDTEKQEKMNVYVESINKISNPVLDGYSYYTKYVEDNKGPAGVSNIYFQAEINDFETKLKTLEEAAKKEPKLEIDAFATKYIAAAKKVIALHNELSKYYHSKQNTVDNGALGIAKHPEYIKAINEFRPIAKQISDAHKKYYKETNATYLKKLEVSGDKIRLAGNKIMNAADELRESFSAAMNKDNGKYNPEMDKVMQQTMAFQKLIDDYDNIVKATSETEMKRHFKVYTFTRIPRFSDLAKDMLESVRSCIDGAKKNETTTINMSYDQVFSKNSEMVSEFNTIEF